jgi:hypothetical protein
MAGRDPGSGGPHMSRWGRAASPQQLHEHQRLVDGVHAHALGDRRAQALVVGVTGGGTGELNSKPLNMWSESLAWMHQLYSDEIAPSEASADGGTFLSG